MSAPIKQQIMKKLGYRLLVEDQLVLIERDGRAHRLAGPGGYIRLNAISEQFGPTIRIRPRSAQLTLHNVRSADRIPFSINVKVLYNFNPRRCNPQIGFDLVRNAPGALEAIVQYYGGQVVRHTAGDLMSIDLCSGQILVSLETTICHDLHVDLLPFGISVLQPSGVTITEIEPPANLKAAYDKAKGYQVIADTLNAVTPTLADRVMAAGLIDKLAANGGSVQLISSLDDLLNLSSNLPADHAVVPTNGQDSTKLSSTHRQDLGQ
jgi:hypothetical protein